jgi:hypothetical protein
VSVPPAQMYTQTAVYTPPHTNQYTAKLADAINNKPWTTEEVARLQAVMVGQHYISWHAVATYVGTRSPGACKVYWRKLVGYLPPRPAPVAVRRLCLRCRTKFDSTDARRNWVCVPCHRLNAGESAV